MKSIAYVLFQTVFILKPYTALEKSLEIVLTIQQWLTAMKLTSHEIKAGKIRYVNILIAVVRCL